MLENLLPNDFIHSETYFWELLCSVFSDISSWGKISTLTIFSHILNAVTWLYQFYIHVFHAFPAFAKYEEDISKLCLSLCIF